MQHWPGRLFLDGRREDLGMGGGPGCRDTADEEVQAEMASSVASSSEKLRAMLKRTSGRPGSRGFSAAYDLQAARLAAAAVSVEVVGDLQLGVADRAMGLGRLRPIGIAGEIVAPGGDRVVELPSNT